MHSFQFRRVYGYATSVTNALGHVVSTVSDPAWGVPTQVTDANSNLTELEYDGYGRLRKVWLPGESKASEPASLEFVYDAAARPAWVQSRTLRVKGSAAYLESWQYVDGFGRPLQSQTPSATSGQRIVSSQQTNALGQLLHQSSPYALSGAAGSGYVAPLWSTVANYQRLSYDELGNQTLSETKSQASVLWSSSALYDGWQRQTTDANGRRTDFEQDAFGQLTKVTEYNVDSIAQATNYAYDLRGGLTGVTDALGNATSMSYDLLGRKTAMSDPDMGSWLYQYDANGNLTGQRDARGLWLYLGYDDLNRLTTKRQDDPTSGALLAQYIYDAAGQKGLLSKSRGYSAEGVVEVENLAYDMRNRPTQQQWVVPGVGGGTFRMDAAFDEADQKTSQTYPGGNAGQSGEVVSYGYNAVGQLVSVSGLGGIQYVSSASYNAQGQITQLINENGNGSNGLIRQWVYETNTLRLSTLQAGTAAPFENLQKLSYAYDNAGNITTLTDGTNSNQTQTFDYDWLNRLTSASTNAAGVGQYDHAYTYDAVGNIASFAGNSYTYGDPAHKHAVTAAFGNTYGYDANGNQTSRTIGGVSYTFAYDYENRVTSITGSGVSATFLYDADGQRVKGTVNGVATVYVAGVYEYHGGATTLHYEGNALRRSGYASDNGVFYLLQDHLKSSSAFVTQAGVVNSRNYFFPFGGNRGGSAFNSLTTKRFTGQYHEVGLPGGEGLSYYGARWYDAQLGRFVTPDSIVPGPANPQAFNRYSYVLNSPTNRIDPTGHFDIKPGDTHGRGTVPHEPWFLKPLRWISKFREAQEKVNRMYGSDLGGNLILGMALMKHDEYRIYGKTPPAGLRLTYEWYHEWGAAKREYGPEYEITQWLSGTGSYDVPAEGVQEATQQYWATNGQDMTVEGKSAYAYPFGASDFLEELDQALNHGEWSGSFLGSYRVEIKTIDRIATDVSLVEYTVYNKTGWESGTRYPFPQWLRDALGLEASSRPDVERDAPGKGGTMEQFYVWREVIHR